MQQPKKDYQIRDVGNTVVTLRTDLVFSPQSVGGKPGYVIEDPVSMKFYRIGIPEYKFISLLNGTMSVSDVLSATAATLSAKAFTEREAATICKWLVDTGLAHTHESSQAERLVEAAEKADRVQLLQRLNPMYIRVPLMKPDQFLDSVTSWAGWMHGSVGWTLTAVLGLLACCQLMVEWDRFIVASQGILAPNRWLWLFLAWLLLKVVHEMAHGVVCKKYGGSVKETGVMFVLFAPLAYVDVTSSWRFHSKWQRIHTAAAGMYVELLVASLAAIVWSYTEPGLLNETAFNLVAMASLMTLLFNANPLMKFDGYYILSDLLEIPNLYAKGHQYLSFLGRRYLLGVESESFRWTGRKGFIIRIYGIASCAWRMTICVTLTIAAAKMFAGAGIVLAALGTVLWLGPATQRFVKTYLTDEYLTRHNRLHFLATTGAGIAFATTVLTVVPWPRVVRAPAIVEYSPLLIVRASSPGFVEQILVHNNQSVQEGDVLAVLANDELRRELAELKLDLEESLQLSRTHKINNEMAAFQAEVERQAALAKRHKQKQHEVDQLTIRAPISGQIIGRNLDTLDATYLRKGAEIFSIGNKSSMEVRISVSQDDLETFTDHVSKPMAVRLAGNKRFLSELETVSPRASMEPLHAALCA
ncbi:MAG: efflux RND transporter periplasmic adaptor subunit, partial [Planctomycetales bacterium]|nr:efflux RND transporter periplasmic adaptor subunit [Planctomycetales bacterium]